MLARRKGLGALITEMRVHSNHFLGDQMSRKGWLLFIAISIFWGIPYLFIKIAVSEPDPAIVVFARIGIAAVVLIVSQI
jgi:hypothetical protein